MVTEQKKNTLNTVLRPIIDHRIRTIRTIIQLVMFCLINGLIFGLARIDLLLPIQYPTAGPFTAVWSAFDALQYSITFFMLPYLAISIFVLFGILVGKTSCGWICPFGLVQDLTSYGPTKKKRVSKPTNKSLSGGGMFIVILTLILALIIGITYDNTGLKTGFNMWRDIPFSVIDPSATLFGTLYYYLKWGIQSDTFGAEMGEWTFWFWVRIVLLVITLILIAIFPRAYCRWFCPTGALLGVFSKYSILGLKRNPNRCPSGCVKCVQACPTQVDILKYEKEVTDSACINCGECIDACPEGALKLTLRF